MVEGKVGGSGVSWIPLVLIGRSSLGLVDSDYN